MRPGRLKRQHDLGIFRDFLGGVFRRRQHGGAFPAGALVRAFEKTQLDAAQLVVPCGLDDPLSVHGRGRRARGDQS